MKRRAIQFALLAPVIVTFAACGGMSPGGSSFAPAAAIPAPAGSSKIQHVIIVIQENRSFDNFFATFPGADGTKTGKMEIVHNGKKVGDKTIPLKAVSLIGDGKDIDHTHKAFDVSYDNGAMDGFNLAKFGAGGSGVPTGRYSYQYVKPSEIAPYWTMARQYVLVDHMFQTQGSGSFTAHQDLIAGGTDISDDVALIDNPSNFPWGCDAKKSVVTAIIKKSTGLVYPYGGPFPCLKYATLRDLLDAKRVSWKFYAVAVQKASGPQHGNTPGVWSAFDAIKAVRYGSEWRTNVTRTNLDIFTDITKKRLPAVAWVTPDADNSDHPGEGSDTGPSWVASIVNAIGKSSYWNSTAIVIVWDDWGGLYDHVAPPLPRTWEDGPGFRVPALIVSPYVRPHVEHTVYQLGSILRFIEDNWNLGSLGASDATSTSLGNAFNFTISPRKFKPLSVKYPQSYFLQQKPSGLPVDTE